MIGEIVSGLIQFAKGATALKDTYQDFGAKRSRRAIIRFTIYLETLHDQTELLIKYCESVHDGSDAARAGEYPTQTQLLQRILTEVTATHAKVAEYFFLYDRNRRSAVVDALAPFAANLRSAGYIAINGSQYVFYNSKFRDIKDIESVNAVVTSGDLDLLKSAHREISPCVSQLREHISANYTAEEVLSVARSLYEDTADSSYLPLVRDRVKSISKN